MATGCLEMSTNDKVSTIQNSLDQIVSKGNYV